MYCLQLEVWGYNYETFFNSLLMEYLHDQFSLAVKLTWKMPALITPAALLVATIHCSSCADTAVQGLLWCLTTMVKTLAPTRLCCFNPLFHGPILKQHPTFCWAGTKEGCKTRVKCYCRWLLHWRNTFHWREEENATVAWCWSHLLDLFLVWGALWSLPSIQRCYWLTL